MKKVLSILVILLVLTGLSGLVYSMNKTEETKTTSDASDFEGISINVEKLTYSENNEIKDLKVYTQDDYNDFLESYSNGVLPSVYVTEFLFDGASMYKTYDLDDFIEEGNEVEVKALNIKAFNIISGGDYEFTGSVKGGMIAINSNDLDKDINIYLNNVNIDTDSKKVPALYVYNKDTNYTDYKVTIKTEENTKNYLEGGKLKKVSLIPSEELTSYSSKYSSSASDYYANYTNYYGVYTKNQIDNVLFAKVTADSEDLADADPYYFYKAAGAVSSDIDLYFSGLGYLEVTSKNKEGIETKGNLSLIGGSGDYKVSAQDDCLNTTTKLEISSSFQPHNTLTIDVNSLTAIVNSEADEGDAIDSNGELIINGGTIIAIAKSGSDAGLDSESGTTINGGTVLSTGDMYDEIKSSSTQNFMVLSFNTNINSGELLTLLDSEDNHIFTYLPDRTFRYLVYSSKDLVNGTYSLYKDGSISLEDDKVLYTNLSNYTKGTLMGYSSTGVNNVGPGANPGDMTPPNMNRNNSQGMTSPNMQGNNSMTATNKDFTINGISNMFNGVSTYSN